MKPAARFTNQHSCPAQSLSPRAGGPVLGPGAPAIFVEDLPTALIYTWPIAR